MNRQRKTFDEVCDITSSKRIYAADYEDDGVPFYRSKEIIEKQKGKSALSNNLFISEEKFEQIKNKFGAPVSGDLLLTSVGTLGIPYVIKKGERFYFKDGNLTWFRNLTGVTSQYLYYWFLSDSGKAELKKATIGSSQSALTIVLLKKMEMLLPSVQNQKNIASILSAYDDLIENNTRRIAILEQMAQRIYEEWFVKFRFPGHEQVQMVESELGLIPEGWKIKRLDEIVENVKVSTKAGEHLKKRKYVPIECISKKQLALLEYFDWSEAKSSLILFEENDFLFGAMRPYFHKVAIAPFAGITRTTCFVLRAKTFNSWAFSGLTLFSEQTVSFANQNSSGATIPYAVWDNAMAKMNIVFPTEDLLIDFQNLIFPILTRLKSIIFQQENLRKTRDLLLPKLISGGVDVSHFPNIENV